ncbi:response regulator [Nitrincola iocasae]|jgi:two-component system chemotaxis response regulator CheY|uniref:Response regulator n=1 Tax=Nitrincola iocasae TaxID=2614693 RepID=A0A5J6LCH2_9GAMM|nr:response regulator [Nitrincola iocasae]QEW05998.1 response regulator [Nitrincola iocasae]
MELQELLILVIEPSRMQRNIITNHLRSLGVQAIEEFSDASEALERMRSITPDIVMSAMHLPDMTGSELVGEMRKVAGLDEVVFFLISSETLYRYLEPIRQSGAATILPKPFDPEELRKALLSAVEYVDDRQNADEDHDDAFEDLWVLVVDDSKMSRRYLSRILTSLGVVNQREAKDGAEALQVLKNQRFDLVITDYNMPNIDGLELVQHIRQYTDQPAVPVLVVTSEQDEEPLISFKQVGVTAICRKPLSYHSLKQLLKHLIVDQTI